IKNRDVHNEPRDLQDRTKRFALQVIRTFSTIPKTTPAQVVQNNCFVQAHQSEQIIARHIGGAVRWSSSRNVATRCASLKRPLIGLNRSLKEKSSLQNTRSYPAGMCRVDCYFRNNLKTIQRHFLILPCYFLLSVALRQITSSLLRRSISVSTLPVEA